MTTPEKAALVERMRQFEAMLASTGRGEDAPYEVISLGSELTEGVRAALRDALASLTEQEEAGAVAWPLASSISQRDAVLTAAFDTEADAHTAHDILSGVTRPAPVNGDVREALTKIRNLCDAPHWNADRRVAVRNAAADALAALSPEASAVEAEAWRYEELSFGQWCDRVVVDEIPEEGRRVRNIKPLYASPPASAGVREAWDRPIEELCRAKAGHFFDVSSDHPTVKASRKQTRDEFIEGSWQNWREDAVIEVAALAAPPSPAPAGGECDAIHTHA